MSRVFQAGGAIVQRLYGRKVFAMLKEQKETSVPSREVSSRERDGWEIAPVLDSVGV